MNSQGVHAFFRDEESPSSSVHTQPPATIDIAMTAPPPDRAIQASPAISPHSKSAPGPDSDEYEEEMPDLHIPVPVIPTILSIPNARF